MSKPTIRSSLCPVLLLGLLALPPAAARGAPQGVRFLGGDPSRIHISVEVPAITLNDVSQRVGMAGAVQLDIAGYAASAAPGEPELPERVVMVAVPPRGEVRVQAVGRDLETREGVVLAPAPFVARGEEDRPRRYAPVREAYEGSTARDPEPARLLDVSWIRNQRVARILVRPSDYQPALGRLRTFRALDIEVAIEGAAPAGEPERRPDPFERLYRELLVNYEQGKAWRLSQRDRSAWLGAGGADRARPWDERLGDPSPARGAGAPSGVFAGRTWIKIGIETSGFYQVDFGQLRNFALFAGDTSTVLDSLRLFAWPGHPVLPEGNYCDGCDYQEVAISVVDNGDGRFNRNSDALSFFALGPNDWANLYNPARPDTDFVNHPYETKSYLFLTVSRPENPVPGAFRRIAQQSAAVMVDGGEITPASYDERVHQEMDTPAEFLPDLFPGTSTLFWEKWFWQRISAGATFRSMVDLPGFDPAGAARLRVRMWGVQVSGSHFADVSLNGLGLGRVSWNDRDTGANRIRPWGHTFDRPVTNAAATGNRVEVHVPQISSGREDQIAIAWYDLFYKRLPRPVADAFAFASPSGAGNFIHRIGPFASAVPPRVFDVTDPFTPIELLGFAYDPVGAEFTLSFETTQSERRRYRLHPGSFAKVSSALVASAPPTSLEDLRSPSQRADYLIIHFDGFKAAADTLAAWRRDFNGFEVKTVPISALYDQFSGGRTDPAAIRNFLRAAFLYWDEVPAYVTLLGDASYDFKNLKGRAVPGQPGTPLPSYEGGYDPAVQRQFATDDWLLNVDNPSTIVPDFFGGRLPAGDAATALDMVRGKILHYERNAPFGEYRDRVMLVADDNMQGAAPDGLGWIHLGQTSELDTLVTPQHIDRVYVYLHTYADGPGATKPGAKSDIRTNINDQGVAMFNFVGHGSPFKISDEGVMLDTDVGTLTNRDRLPVFVAASCDIGKFNDPTLLSLGERLLTHPSGGAVGVISATELAFSNQNAQLNRDIYSFVFARDTTGRYRTTLAEALLMSKLGATNTQKYQLMGDPAVRLNLPELWADVALWDSSGTVQRLSVGRGETVMVRGRVTRGPGGAPVVLDGVAALRIEDAQPPQRVDECIVGLGYVPPCRCIQPTDSDPFNRYREPCYYFTPGPMFLGDVELRGGLFEGRFVVPMEAKLGGRARVRAYFNGGVPGTSEQRDGVGSLFTSVVQGTAPAGDKAGPRVALAFAGGATAVKSDATLFVDLFDPSGILITGHTPQNGIIVTVDENTTQRFDITSSFRYAADSYQAGTASFQLPNLSRGPHRVRVSAADNLAAGIQAGIHRSSAVIDFEVFDLPPLKITSAFLFPNPIRSRGPGSGGQFVVDAPGDSINIMIRVYTVSGRLVRVLKAFGGIGQIQVPWDGRDAKGDEIASGAYVFKVHANVRDEEGESSPRQQAVSEGRIVVVN